MSSTASTSITTSPTKVAISASLSSGIGTTTPTTGMTMTTSNSGGLSPLEQEIFALKAQLEAVSAEKNVLQETLRNIQCEAPQDSDPSSPSYSAHQSQSTSVYEARLTELHSVIAELKKQLDIRREQIIPEESTDFEEDYELDTEELFSIDHHHHLNADTDPALKMNFINSKVAGKGGLGVVSFRSGNQNLQHNQSHLQHHNNHNNHNHGNNGSILLTTPSDEEEDELESSSGMMDSSPVNNDNNLPSDVDVDGVYFEDDQIIATEGFGLKCGELRENGRAEDVINTNGLTCWKGGTQTTKVPMTTADTNNCNVSTFNNPLIQDDLKKLSPEKVVDLSNGHSSDKSLSFSPLSSPESPEDNNGAQQLLLGTGAANLKLHKGGSRHVGEDEGLRKVDGAGENGDNEEDIHGDDDRGENIDLGGGGVGRSFGRQLQQLQEQSQSPHHQQPHRRPPRRHRRNSNNSRNRDSNFITASKGNNAFPSSSCSAPAAVVPPSAVLGSGSNALEIQNRERPNNAHLLKGNRHQLSALHAMMLSTSACKPEKLRSGVPIGGGSSGSLSISPAAGGLVITSMRTTPSESSPSPESCKPPVQFASLCYEVARIREEHGAIKDDLCKKEGELDRTRSALENIAKERDYLKHKVSELEQLLKQSPKRLPLDLSTIPVDDSAPICKLAERVKLHRHALSNSNSSANSPHHQSKSGNNGCHNKSQSPGGGNDPFTHNHHQNHLQPSNVNNPGNESSSSPEAYRRSSRHSRSHHRHHSSQHIHNNHHSRNHSSMLPSPPPHQKESSHCGLTGADLMLIGSACSTRVVEHLVQPIKNESGLRELQHSMSQNGVSPLNEEKLREFEIETERLSSKIDHLRSQNDVLTLNLEDAKSHADRLTVLLGKYESNNVALQLAVGYSDHTIEAYDILVALLESELGQLLANLRATGIGANSSPHEPLEDANASGFTTKTTSFNSALSSPIAQTPPYSTANIAIQKRLQQGPISSAGSGNSGNNNNSNDNSPTGEHSKASVPKSNLNNTNGPSTTTTTTTATLIVATSATTTTMNGSSSPLAPFISQEEMDIKALIERANENRRTAENAARVLLSRFMMESPGSENNNSLVILPGGTGDNHNPNSHPYQQYHHQYNHNHGQTIQPWEETSSCSQTLSSASSLGDNSNGSPSLSQPGSRQGVELAKNEESRIRDLIITLKTDREGVRQTVTEVESWSLESLYPSKPPSPCDILEARKLDLETAVLMQELMAMREERAELRAQLFLLEKEKTSFELRLQSHETQEEAYKARINYLKSEIHDYQNNCANSLTVQKVNQNQQQLVGPDGNANPSSGTTPGTNPMEREQILKKRIKELATALEKVTHNSKLREKQNHEVISELKRANGILIETLEAAKKKYQSRIRKMEEQIMAIMERHSMQLKLHKDRIHYLELENKEQRTQQQQFGED